MERLKLITDYSYSRTDISRIDSIRQSKSAYLEKKINESSRALDHNYSGDPIYVQLDENGNWESDYFSLSK